MSVLDDLMAFFVNPIKVYGIPDSTFIVIGVAFLLSVITTGANRFLVNYKMVSHYRREFMAWQQAVKKARKEGDEKQLDKLMKRQAAVMKMSSRASLEQMKTTAVTFIPLLLMYSVLVAAYPVNVAVAFSPIIFPGAAITGSDAASFLSVVYWYFLSSFAISIPLSKLFGVQTFSITPGSESK